MFTTQIVDLDRHRLLDVVEGRSRDLLGRWLADRGVDWCHQIRLATLDPSAGYRVALAEHLPQATQTPRLGYSDSKRPQTAVTNSATDH